MNYFIKRHKMNKQQASLVSPSSKTQWMSYEVVELVERGSIDSVIDWLQRASDMNSANAQAYAHVLSELKLAVDPQPKGEEL